MKIGKYISELLFENDFVILPQVGEFSTKYIPAKFIPELKKVESPSKIVTFNPSNKSGGGLLIEYMAKKEGVSSEQAKHFVDSFVSEMLNSLHSGKKVELENIGMFNMEQGNLVFEADKNVNYLGESIGMPSVNEPVKKSEEEAKSELDKVLDDLDGAEPPVQPVQELTDSPSVEEPVEDSVKEDSPSEPPVVEPIAEPIKKEEPVKSATTVPLGQRQPIGQQRFSKEKQSKEKSIKITDSGSGSQGLPPALKWVALTVVPLLVIIIVVALNFEYLFGDKSVIFKKDQPVAPARVEASTSTPQQQAEQVQAQQPAQPQTQPAQATPQTPQAGRQVYHIIVGSFEEEHSALILVEELRNKGAANASVFPINRQGFYRVSYGFYYDLSEAERELERANQINPQSWILHR